MTLTAIDSLIGGRSLRMLVLKLDTEIPLTDPTVSFGFVNWLDITIREFDSANPSPIGSARVAVLLCAEALNNGASMQDVLDEDSDELGVLDAILFEDGTLKDAYSNGDGMDVLYFESLELRPEWRERNVEEAVVDACSTCGGRAAPLV